jgi:hypothetical protein
LSFMGRGGLLFRIRRGLMLAGAHRVRFGA